MKNEQFTVKGKIDNIGNRIKQHKNQEIASMSIENFEKGGIEVFKNILVPEDLVGYIENGANGKFLFRKTESNVIVILGFEDQKGKKVSSLETFKEQDEAIEKIRKTSNIQMLLTISFLGLTFVSFPFIAFAILAGFYTFISKNLLSKKREFFNLKEVKDFLEENGFDVEKSS